MLKKLLYKIVEWIAYFHDVIMRMNDSFENSLSDKELHFWVIGIIGMAMIFIVYPVFKWLAKHDLVMVITWIYVFTMILVLTFAIEIGQKITGTGRMEFIDIVSGVIGFILMFMVFALIREAYHWIRDWIKGNSNK